MLMLLVAHQRLWPPRRMWEGIPALHQLSDVLLTWCRDRECGVTWITLAKIATRSVSPYERSWLRSNERRRRVSGDRPARPHTALVARKAYAGILAIYCRLLFILRGAA